MANESTGYPRAGNRTSSARARREEYWRRILARQQQGGLSRAAFCRREGIKDGALSWWARELRVRDRVRSKPKKSKSPFCEEAIGAESARGPHRAWCEAQWAHSRTKGHCSHNGSDLLHVSWPWRRRS